MSFNGIVGNNGSVIGHSNVGNNLGGYQGGPSSSSKIQAPSHLSYNHDLGIILAKDKEINVLNLFLEEFGYDCKVFEGELNYRVVNIEGKTVAFTFINDMGFDKMSLEIKKFIKVVKPKYVTTIGICASLKSNLQKVLIFTASKCGLDEDNTTIVDPKIKAALIPDIWRTHDFIVEPKKPSFIFTSTKSDPSDYPDVSAEKDISNFLESTKTDGIDMEIAAVFLGIMEWNKYCQKNLTVTPLPAFKATSDYGTKSIRKANCKEAAINASKAFVLYVKWLVSQGY